MKKFLPLWAGDFVSDIGTAAYLFIIPVIAVTVFTFNDLELAVLLAVIMIAPGLLSAFLGAAADKLQSYRSMQATNLVRMVLMLVMVLLAASENFNILLFGALAFLISCCALFMTAMVSL